MKTSILIFATLWLIAPHVTAADFPKAASEFVEKHCAECHDDLTPAGDFRIDRLGTDLADEATNKRWARVLARVQNGEMPPVNQKDRPTSAESAVALQALRLAFQDRTT